MNAYNSIKVKELADLLAKIRSKYPKVVWTKRIRTMDRLNG